MYMNFKKSILGIVLLVASTLFFNGCMGTTNNLTTEIVQNKKVYSVKEANISNVHSRTGIVSFDLRIAEDDNYAKVLLNSDKIKDWKNFILSTVKILKLNL